MKPIKKQVMCIDDTKIPNSVRKPLEKGRVYAATFEEDGYYYLPEIEECWRMDRFKEVKL